MKIGTRIGIVVGIILSVYIFSIRYFQMTQNKFGGFGIFLIIVLGAVSSCLAFDKETNYTSSFGKIFGSGFATTASATFITVAITLLSYALVPSLKTQELNELRQQYESMNKPVEETNKNIDETNSHFYSIKSSQYLFPLLLSGALFSALASMAIAKKNKR
jgi:hypothetical protein